MIYLASTRFNKDTWSQNESWKRKNTFDGCVYGTPCMLKDYIIIGSSVIILEMHNDLNKIVGIGLIKNKLALDRRYNIYAWGNYNRYTYKGARRIDRSECTKDEELVMFVLDMLMFKGSRHLKRGQGITCLPPWIIDNKHINFIKKLYDMFNTRFTDCKIG